MKARIQTFLAGVTGAVTVTVLMGATGALNLRNDGIEFPDGTVQTTSAVQGPTYVLLDGNLQEIGSVVPGIVPTYVEMDVSDERLLLRARSADWISVANGVSEELWYTTPDCSGTAYMDGRTFVPFMIGPLGLLYRADPADPPAVRNFQSGLARGHPDCFSQSLPRESQEAVVVADFEAQHPPPYSTERR